jgi:serine/threonine protein kinase
VWRILLGVMLYELLTGELPLGQFDPPSVKKPGIDKRLDAIVSRCLKPAPEDRYPSVGAFLQELELLVPMTTAPAPSKESEVSSLLRAPPLSACVCRPTRSPSAPVRPSPQRALWVHACRLGTRPCAPFPALFFLSMRACTGRTAVTVAVVAESSLDRMLRTS